MTTSEIPSIEDTHSLIPEVDRLPGRCAPYFISSGEGLRYDLGGQLVTVIARPEDTGGQFGAAYVYGGKGVETPFVAHDREHTFLYVLEGRIQLWLPRETQVLIPGDSATIPAGTPYAYRMTAHANKFLSWTTAGDGHAMATAQGTATQSHVFTGTSSPLRDSELADQFGIRYADLEKVDRPALTGKALPHHATPFVVKAGEGERWKSSGQLNTYLARSRNTAGTYFAVHTRGAKSPYIPRHFHRAHTENFFCTEGRILLHVNGQEILLTKGDFVHAPAGTVHSFAFDGNSTQMLGILTTGIFEKFFEYMNTPTDDNVHDELNPGSFPESGFARARAELDLVVVGPPPARR
ncbi:quercetin 2,3-dioxygenase [Rhodococcus sp. BP-252]|uniref:Cupin n=1 Tax=Rhodococcoides kyotonense TaxID=398843 RepID=A0A177YDD8_9NOCA|nr:MULTISPECIES: quercetin 2,3-dioxygenase [Rhodococcus]MBY6412996.1 quercetin 2,3-dioxygenase [Rhodococcus sp. BP-320]MBY6418565.1 quercetin 2,3-dioxygenase [Rhodococcus sp. BP-321]MBY6422733.1 quercetin 2,3-dioxygenase [Rhodococcus sp. BP-324]MBY6428469.1 quercetin 2,3-dioxygenase [Rhodococcus sp. BP-323]MBY6432918.1 quercetin 2,3-dioxygenase [Rhodococcus sp. BP-322]